MDIKNTMKDTISIIGLCGLIVVISMTVFLFITLMIGLDNPSSTKETGNDIYTICPPADFPVNAHIDCSNDGILLYVPRYLTHKNYTYSVEYDNTSPYNGTWILSSEERNTGNNSVVLAWCE